MSESEAAGTAKGAGSSQAPAGETAAGAEAGAAAETGAGEAQAGPARTSSPRKRVEETIPRGLWIRLFVYFVAGHLFAGFIYLLFALGGGQ